jgi:hypothetical protein
LPEWRTALFFSKNKIMGMFTETHHLVSVPNFV